MTTTELDGATSRRQVSTGVALGSHARPVAIWATHIAAAALLLLAGVAKLGRGADAIGLYEVVGIGQWFSYLAGSIEVMTAVSLLIPLPAFVAGIGLALTVVETGFTGLAFLGV